MNGDNEWSVGAPSFAPAGPQPTKPVVKPEKAMKQLHWKRLLIDANEAKSSIWYGNDDKPKIDEKQLATLFGAKAAKQLGGGPSSPGPSPLSPASPGSPGASSSNGDGASPSEDRSQQKNIRSLNDKRFNALSIILSKKKNDPNVFIEVLYSLIAGHQQSYIIIVL
jgi:hypothetical protein